ncbi:MAG: PAS domain-containing protein, partial [Candidatus Hodarchaeota archaeon]
MLSYNIDYSSLLLIMENVNDLITIINKNFQHEYINENAYFNLLGYKKEEILGHTALEVIHPDDIKRAGKALRDGFQQGEGTVEFRIKHKDGSYYWLGSKGITFLDKDGDKKALIISRDITKRKLAKERIKESEDRYRNLFESSPNAILIINYNGVITDCNLTTEKLSGFKKEELIGKNFQSVSGIYEQDLPYVLDVFKAILKGKQPNKKEIRLYTKERVPVWVSFQVSTFSSGGEKLIQVTFEVIEEKKAAEKNLMESEARYKLLANNINDIIWTMDLDFNTTFVSPSITSILGYSVEEDMAKSFSEKFTPESLKKITKLVKEHLNPKNINDPNYNPSLTFEIEQYHKDGSIVPTEVKVNPLRDENGIATGFIGVTRDITERKKAEKILIEQEVKFKNIVENMDEIVIVSDFDGKNVYFSPKYEKILGDPPYSQNVLFSQIHQQDREILVKIFENVIRNRGTQGISRNEFRYEHKDGRTLWLSSQTDNYINDNGEVIGFITSLRDITEKKEAEQKLKESEEKFRTITEQSFMGILIIQDYKIKYSNQ